MSSLSTRQVTNGSSLLVALILALAAAFAYISMPWGPGVTPDSVIYLGLADALYHGEGFFLYGDLVTHYPPGYPATLALLNVITDDSATSARLLNSVAYAASLGLIFTLIGSSDKRTSVVLAVCGLVYFCSTAVVSAHLMAWSEPAFILVWLVSTYWLITHLLNPQRYALILAGVFLGLAILYRYAGIALVPPMLFIILIIPQNIKPKLKELVLLLAISLVGLCFWLFRNNLLSGNSTNRQFIFHPVGYPHFESFASVLNNFFTAGLMTPTAAIWVTALILFAITALLVRNSWKLSKDTTNIDRHLLVSILFSSSALAYVMFILVSISFIDAHTPMDERILPPFLVCLIVLIANEISNIEIGKQHQQLAIVLCLSLLTFSTYKNTTGSGSLLSTSRVSGLGYAHRSIIESPAVVFAGMLPPEHQIYSNGFDLLNYSAQRNAIILPEEFEPATRNRSVEYETKMTEMCSEVKNGHASIIFMTAFQGRWYLPNAEKIASSCGVEKWLSLGDSLILTTTSVLPIPSNLPD